jgi:hypothetical protein
MANEVISTGNTGRSIQSEVLARMMQAAIYSFTTILPTARIDSPEGASLTKRYTRHPVLTDASVTEIESITNSAWSPDQQSVATSRFGIALEHSDLWSMGSIVSGGELAAQAAAAVRNGIDTRLAATYSNFTPVVNRTGAQFRLEDFLSAQFTIEDNELWQRGQIVARLAPKQVQDLRDSIRAATGSVLGSDTFAAMGTGRLDMLGNAWTLNGVNIQSSRNVASVTTDIDRQGAMYPAGQLGPILYQEKRAPAPEFDREVRTSTTVVVVTAYYETANLFADEGVKIISRAS